MNLRNHYPSLAAVGVALGVLLLLGGAAAVGVVSLSEFTSEEDANNTTAIEPPSPDALPPGYHSTGISHHKAVAVHKSQLEDTAYVYEYSQRRETPRTSETLKLTVSENGTVTGFRELSEEYSVVTRYEYISEDGQLYTVSQNGTKVREFANSNYANGQALIQQAFEYGNFTLTRFQETEDGTLYLYSFDAPNSSADGTMIVTESGRINRVSISTTENGAEVHTSFTIRVAEEE